MKKKIIALLFGALTISCTTAFANAFDTPEEEYAYWQRVNAQQAWADKYINNAGKNNPIVHAVPAFDTPEQEAEHWKFEKKKEVWISAHINNTAVENPTYFAVPAFDTPEEEFIFWLDKNS